MRLLLFAAVTDVFVVMLEFLFQKAAAGVVGPAFRRTAADVAVAGAFPGDRMGHSGRFQRQRRKRTHDDQRIDHSENQSDYGAGWFFHAVIMVRFPLKELNRIIHHFMTALILGIICFKKIKLELQDVKGYDTAYRPRTLS